MSLDVILATIDAESARAISSIRQETQEQITRLEAEAGRRAAEEQRRMATTQDDAAALATARIVNRARLNAERRVRDAREVLYEEAHRRMMARLAEVRDNANYHELLAQLLAEARAVLPDASVVLVDPRDVRVMGEVGANLSPAIDVRPELATLGGLELVTSDGRRVRNTLESRAHKAEASLRMLVVDLAPELGGGG